MLFFQQKLLQQQVQKSTEISQQGSPSKAKPLPLMGETHHNQLTSLDGSYLIHVLIGSNPQSFQLQLNGSHYSLSLSKGQIVTGEIGEDIKISKDSVSFSHSSNQTSILEITFTDKDSFRSAEFFVHHDGSMTERGLIVEKTLNGETAVQAAA